MLVPHAKGFRWVFAAAFLAIGCAPSRPLNTTSAGVLAARLANDRCQRAYGARPFAPEDFEAVMERNRWHWGAVDAERINEYDVDVSFDAKGGSPSVKVSLPPQ